MPERKPCSRTSPGPGEDIRALKRQARALLKERSLALPPGEWRRLSLILCRRLWEDPFYAEAKTVFCFVGVRGETDTRPFLTRVLEDGKILAVPRCGPGGTLTAHVLTDPDALRPGAWGLPEPEEDTPVLPREETDLAVVPCLGADREGFRLGRGGGYYDRYLAGFPGRSLLVCPRFLLLDRVPREPFDLPADRLITDETPEKPF